MYLFPNLYNRTKTNTLLFDSSMFVQNGVIKLDLVKG